MKHQKGFTQSSFAIAIIILVVLLCIGLASRDSNKKVEKTSLEKHCAAQQIEHLVKGDVDVFNLNKPSCIPLK